MKKIAPFLFIGLTLALWFSVSAGDKGYVGLTHWGSAGGPTNNLVVHGEPLAVTNYVELVRIGLKVPGQWFNHTSRTVVFSESNDILTNTVNLLVSSGQFCSVRGHTWSFAPILGVYQPGQRVRQCAICRATQTSEQTEWK